MMKRSSVVCALLVVATAAQAQIDMPTEGDRTFQFTVPYTLSGIDTAVKSIAAVCHVGQADGGWRDRDIGIVSSKVAVKDLTLNAAGAYVGEFILRWRPVIPDRWLGRQGVYECGIVACSPTINSMATSQVSFDPLAASVGCLPFASYATGPLKISKPDTPPGNPPYIKGTFTF